MSWKNGKNVKTAAHATQILMNWEVIIACPKQRVKRSNKDKAFVQIIIHQNKKLQYSGILCYTWERLLCTGKLLKHSLGSTITLTQGGCAGDWTQE